MYPVSVKGVLFSPKRELVLLLNERDEWELPGGRIEIGESSTECLAREIREELNIEVEVGAPIDSYLFEVVPGKRVFIATYRCALAGSFSPSISHEHKRLGLYPLGSLPTNLPTGYRASIEAVHAELCPPDWTTRSFLSDC
jgi:8-oxo-dGTP pyrophosphatase MutT (NUDIX family)